MVHPIVPDQVRYGTGMPPRRELTRHRSIKTGGVSAPQHSWHADRADATLPAAKAW